MKLNEEKPPFVLGNGLIPFEPNDVLMFGNELSPFETPLTPFEFNEEGPMTLGEEASPFKLSVE